MPEKKDTLIFNRKYIDTKKAIIATKMKSKLSFFSALKYLTTCSIISSNLKKDKRVRACVRTKLLFSKTEVEIRLGGVLFAIGTPNYC
jgi:hypothetical protein